MIFWIVIGIVVYLAIGVGLLVWAVTSDPWGGMILEYALPVILIWPLFVFLAIKNCYLKVNKKRAHI
ncbi:hypothetical protein OF864_01185 [Bacillus cereus]|uniref:hypothetical protein n=1 Tax=Bacillus TaxID=1386 RepID=UPI0024BB1E04|nr:hypothetical protein [Bacillus cereus]WHS76009.1 hypothetical protein OF864_01185 [Bacillus cereus]